MQMAGLAGIAGWRWIFIIEGIVRFDTQKSSQIGQTKALTECGNLKVTCVVAFFAYFLLVDFPEKAHKSWKFLNQQESDFIIRRLNKDRGDALPDKFKLGRFLRPALDFKLWALGLISL